MDQAKPSSDRRIFLAGAAGAVGQPLCRLLVADGWQVTGTTRSAERAETLRTLGVEPVIVDVYDASALHDAVVAARPDVVIHQLTDLPYGLDPTKMEAHATLNRRIREEGTRNLIAAAVAAGAQRFVAQSICFIYAPGPMPFSEDAPLNVHAEGRPGASARAALALEEQVLGAPMAGIALRYGRFYGPGTGVDLRPTGAPLHVHAAADAARRAATRGERGRYNLAEPDGYVSSDRAAEAFDWSPDFRLS
jgi:nucleoside-diphosphate-sugar epimerase